MTTPTSDGSDTITDDRGRQPAVAGTSGDSLTDAASGVRDEILSILQDERFRSERADMRRADLRQLAVVLDQARSQAERIGASGVAVAHPDLALWRLGRPGYLRALVDEPVSSGGSFLLLTPVGLTWAALGLVEALYARRYEAQPVPERPPFFADWIAAPVWRGPSALSFVVVLTIVVLALLAKRSSRSQRKAYELDDLVRDWEVRLHRPVETLRALVEDERARDRPERALLQAARRMEAAAEKTWRAAGSLGQVEPLIVGLGGRLADLGSAIERLNVATPRLARQAEALREVDGRLRDTASGTKAMLDESLVHTRAAWQAATAANAAALTGAATSVTEALAGTADRVAGVLRAGANHTETVVAAASEQADTRLAERAAATERALRDVAQESDSLLRQSATEAAAVLTAAATAIGTDLEESAHAMCLAVASSAREVESGLRAASSTVASDLRAATSEITLQAAPLTSVIRDTAEAATAVRAAADLAAGAMQVVAAQVADARTVTEQAEAFRKALQQAAAPFGEATNTLRAAVDGIGTSTQALRNTSDRLDSTVGEAREVIKRVNMFSLVVDGIRRDADEHTDA